MSQNVRIRRGRSSTASSVNRNLVNVTAPPALFPPTPGSTATGQEVSDVARGGFSTTEPTPTSDEASIAQRRGVDPTGELRVPLGAIRETPSRPRGASVSFTPDANVPASRPPAPIRRETAATTATATSSGRAPPRARSRTINSIFSSASVAPSPAVAGKGSYAGPPFYSNGDTFDFPRTTSPTDMASRRRRSSVSSSRSSNGPPGVPVALQLPTEDQASPGRRRGTLESMLDKENGAAVARGRPRSSSWAAAQAPTGAAPTDVVKTEGSLPTEPEDGDEDEVHPGEVGEDHHDAIVDHLDCIDPTVSFVSHLQNVSSSILLPGFMSSRAVLSIPHLPTIPSEVELQGSQKLLPPAQSPPRLTDGSQVVATPDSAPARRFSDATGTQRVPGRRRSSVVAPSIGGGRPRAGTTASRRSRRGSTATYITLPHDDPLDAHVADVLTKRQKIKRALKGLGKFLLTPLGVFFFFYGIAVVFWGAAIVFFLAHWIPVKDTYTNDLWVEISSQVVNGLFTITGVGLAPQRCLDSWRIFTIWRLQRLTLKRLRERNLPCPANADDLPDPLLDHDFVPVLSQKQQDLLRRQQQKFSASQTWYRPHETDTHRAFPIKLALLNALFMVGNSAFQMMLCGTMWSLSAYSGDRILLRMGTTRSRPPWTTGCLIPLSFLCGIAAGVIVWRGGERSKKVKEVEEKLMGALGIEEVDEEDEEENRGPEKGAGEKVGAIADEVDDSSKQRRRTRRSLDERDEDGDTSETDVVKGVKGTI